MLRRKILKAGVMVFTRSGELHSIVNHSDENLIFMAIQEIIEQYFPKNSLSGYYYQTHVEAVTKFALSICKEHPNLKADEKIVEKGAMLHDIGICRVNAPDIGCFGEQPYICHGILGAEIIMQELNDSKIARICKTHIGMGITIEDIEKLNLPLPKENMVPETIEEQIVCFADKFFSKTKKNLTHPKALDEVQRLVGKFGEEKLKMFNHLVQLFGTNSL